MMPFRRNPRPERQNWRTPQSLFDYLHSAFGFTVDACASPHDALLPRYWSAAERERWTDERVFCNPPFSKTERLLRKATEAQLAVVVAMLNQLSTRYVRRHPPDYLVIPSYRVRFHLYDPPSGPTFGSCLLVYTHEEMPRLKREFHTLKWLRPVPSPSARLAELALFLSLARKGGAK